MADLADKANDIVQLNIEVNTKYRKKELEVEATGKCLFCDEPVEGTRRWCNPECREDWQRRRGR